MLKNKKNLRSCLFCHETSVLICEKSLMWRWNGKVLSRTRHLQNPDVWLSYRNRKTWMHVDEWWGCSVLFPEPEVLSADGGALIPPPLTSFLHTKVLGHRLSALLALHRAAPMELAVAARHHLGFALFYSQPALSAQPLATPLLPLVQVLAFLQAFAALGAGQAQGTVLQAVVGRIFEVDQLLAGDGVEGLCNGAAAGRAVSCSPEEIHLQGPVVLLLQIVPHFPELWQLQPAGLSGAASWNTVALARLLHGPLHSLQTASRKHWLQDYAPQVH